MLELASLVSHDKKKYAELIQLILEAESPIPQYGSWVLQHSADMDATQIIPYISQLLQLLEEKPHNAVKRAVLRSIVDVQIPAENLDHAVDLCFRFLEDHNEPVAVKMFSMCVLWNACQNEPELLQELGRQIEVQLPVSSAGFKSRGRKILKDLRAQGL